MGIATKALKPLARTCQLICSADGSMCEDGCVPRKADCMRTVEKALALIALFVVGSSLALGQLSAEEQKEDRTAESLYQAQNFVAASPLFEDLHKRQPASVVYTERLAMSLIGSVNNHPPDEQPAVLDQIGRAH